MGYFIEKYKKIKPSSDGLICIDINQLDNLLNLTDITHRTRIGTGGHCSIGTQGG